MRRAALLVVVAVVAACSSQQAAAPVDLARDVAGKVTVDAMFAHMQALQGIASANGNTRADGTPGYAASVDYVVKVLTDKGFDVSTPEVSRPSLQRQGTQTLVVGNRSFSIDQASLLVQTPPGGLSAPAVHAAKLPGCQAADYAGVKGMIAVTDDTGCSVADKQKAALAAGAVALLVASGRGDQGAPPGLFGPGYYQQLTIPIGVIGADADAALLRTSAPVRLTLDSKTALITSRNVVAQTKTGSTQNVVMVGAHLDSYAKSPGVNDDGSGIAALLETAVQLGSSPVVANAVRFCFWAAEDTLTGSTKYVAGLTAEALKDIALYVNVDMVSSPNAGYFTYDGDQSGQPGTGVTPERVPPGSPGIERTLAGYLNLAGRRPTDQPLGTAADYFPFLSAGVPIGGVTTGGTAVKTAVQVRLWGGTVGTPFDPNYHTPRDTIDAVDRDALGVMGSGVAFVVGTYAQSIEGVNGVPPREQRRRAS